MLKVDAAHQKDLVYSKPPQSQFENFSRDTVLLTWSFCVIYAP